MTKQDAQEKVDKLPDGPEKDAMQAVLDYANFVYEETGGTRMSPYCTKIIDQLREERTTTA